MSEAVERVAPFHDPSRTSRLIKVACWVVGTMIVITILDFMGDRKSVV